MPIHNVVAKIAIFVAMIAFVIESSFFVECKSKISF